MRTDCCELLLTQGYVALLDWEDIAQVKFRWAVSSLQSTNSTKRYAVRSTGRGLIYLHREIIKPPKGLVVDHINGDGLDNRRSNLRSVTPTHNSLNTSRRGYAWSAAMGKWKAYIQVQGKIKHLGYFGSEEEAAEARRLALSEELRCS